MVNGLKERSMPGHALADVSQPRSTEAWQTLYLLRICLLCNQKVMFHFLVLKIQFFQILKY